MTVCRQLWAILFKYDLLMEMETETETETDTETETETEMIIQFLLKYFQFEKYRSILRFI